MGAHTGPQGATFYLRMRLGVEKRGLRDIYVCLTEDQRWRENQISLDA